MSLRRLVSTISSQTDCLKKPIALFAHMKRGFYHDGRFASLLDVVNHYNSFKSLNLTEQEKNDLVEFLKSL